MMKPLVLLTLWGTLWACTPQPSVINTSEGLNQVLAVEGDYAQVAPGKALLFPDDHGQHPKFAIEWWYFTANLKDANDAAYALQWTLFRFAQGSSDTRSWGSHQAYLAHFNIHSNNKAWQFERFARGGLGHASVGGSPLTLALDNWRYTGTDADLFPGTLSADDDNVKVKLSFTPTAPLVLHGKGGYSQKLAAQPGQDVQASYYYSQPFLQVEGELVIDGKPVSMEGSAWFDHEWSSQYLDPNAEGWDWFSLHLSDSEKLMLFRVRHSQQPDYWFGTYVREEQVQSLNANDIKAKAIRTAEVRGRQLPLAWSFELPDLGISLTTEPLSDDQWIEHRFSYYEGAIGFTGSHQGVGFMELTGY